MPPRCRRRRSGIKSSRRWPPDTSQLPEHPDDGLPFCRGGAISLGSTRRCSSSRCRSGADATSELDAVNSATGGALGRALARRDFRGGRDEVLHLSRRRDAASSACCSSGSARSLTACRRSVVRERSRPVRPQSWASEAWRFTRGSSTRRRRKLPASGSSPGRGIFEN